MTGLLYLDDLQVGQRFSSASITIDTAAIKKFAADYDPQPFHLDEVAAEKSIFKGLAASGWHTASISMRLIVESAPLAGGLVGAGGEVTWPRPVRPGDTLHVESEVVEIIPSKSRPDRGIAVVRSQTLNQHGEVVQLLTSKLMVPKCPAA
jgi:acyl dehydratase